MIKKRIVEFVQRNNGINNRTTGFAVGQFLAISFPNKYDDTAVQIFNILTGRPLVSLMFASNEVGVTDAIKVAQWLNEVYSPYLEIPTAKGFEDADVIDLCQWTVPNGIQIRIAFDILERSHDQAEHVTSERVARAYELAAPQVEKWLQYVKPR